MKEKTFENQVKAYLAEKGCWVLKTWSNGIQREGVPDLLVCCKGFFIGIELKNETGHPSDLQLWNIDKIRKAGGLAMVLYPDQFDHLKLMIENLQLDIGKGAHKAWCMNQDHVFDRREKRK